MDQQTLATILTGATVLIALASYLHTINKGLEVKIEKVEAGLGERIGKVDANVDTVNTKVGTKIDKLREETKAEIADLRTDFRFLSQTIIDFLAHPPQRTTPSPSE